MRRRYYLRGLGIGIVVTALIMGVATRDGRPLTDAEVRARAYTLGMVDADSRSLSDMAAAAPSGGEEPAGDGRSPVPAQSEGPEITESPDPSGTPEVTESPIPPESPVPSESSIPSESPIPSENPVPSDPPEVTESPEPARTQEPVASPDTRETITLSIVRGDSSYTVSRRLEEAGLIDDAQGFDSFLVDNGYSRTIRTGTYQIPIGASWEEIAEMIA